MNTLYKKPGTSNAMSPTGLSATQPFSPNGSGLMTPTSATSSNNGDSMPVTIRVKKHKQSKPFLQTPGATAPPQSQQSAQSQLGNKTALSNKT